MSPLALADSAVAVSGNADRHAVFVQGNPGPVLRLTPDQAAELRGAFKLDDGRMLKLSNRSSKVFMEVDGKREQLLPMSQTEFVARGSGDRLEFDAAAYPNLVTLTQLRGR